MANFATLTALFQSSTLFAERQLGECQSIEVGLQPAGAIRAEMPRVIFSNRTVHVMNFSLAEFGAARGFFGG